MLQWKTVRNRSKTYTEKMKELLGKNAHLSTPIVAAEKVVIDDFNIKHELYTTHHESVGVFDEIIFACHPPTAAAILEQGARRAKQEGKSIEVDEELLDGLKQISYADNVIYVHSDTKLMPQRRRAWSSWNCLGKLSEIEKTLRGDNRKNTNDAFEGAESGFGAKAVEKNVEGDRMKAVYVTYWLNRLQNLATEENYFVSLNPHQEPDPVKTHKRLILAHPQFTPATLSARKAIQAQHQGKNGLWFCGAWAGYGFHEDGCRSGFDVATGLSGLPLPWVTGEKKDLMVLPPPNLSIVPSSKSVLALPFQFMRWAHQRLSYDLPVAICKRFIISFLGSAVKHGRLELKFNDGTLKSFGDGSRCGCDDSPVTIRVFDPWFFVKVAMEYDLGLAR